MSKNTLREKAIALRKRGFSYSEILAQVPVAKSTLSLWLRSVGLSVPQKQNITEKRIQAQKRGAATQRRKRILKQSSIVHDAQAEIGSISNRELWLIGTALYWAEGSKEKEIQPGSRASFSNSDSRMISLFLRWLKECAQISDQDVYADLYTHESHRDTVEETIAVWSNLLKKPHSFFRHTYFKKNKIHTKRKNTGALYIGLLRVNIRASSTLNRRITGWIKGIVENCGIV